MNQQTYNRERIVVAEKLEVDEVMDCRTSQFLTAREAIGTDKEQFNLLRASIGEGLLHDKPVYRCWYCGVPVKLIAPIVVGAHFRHTLEDGRCTAKTRGTLSQKEILAIKYNGAKESEAHRAMKEWLVSSLQADPRFQKVEPEETWKAKDRKAWRKPDVQAVFKDIRVAFEVQLSTTFLDVIVERRDFYRQEGGLLFWIFMDFPLEHRLMTLEDVFYYNNLNAFVVSRETAKQSEEAHRFFTNCIWVQPTVSERGILEEWQQKIVGFDELNLDTAHQRAWYFDVQQARRDAPQKLHQQLKVRIRDFCIKSLDESTGYEERVAEWKQISELSAGVGLRLPEFDYKLKRLLLYLFSLEEAKPVGFKYPKLISVAHHAFDHHKPLLWYFGRGCKAFGREQQLLNEDTKGKWTLRRDEIRRKMESDDAEFKADRSFDTVVFALFPAIAQKAQKASGG